MIEITTDFELASNGCYHDFNTLVLHDSNGEDRDVHYIRRNTEEQEHAKHARMSK